MKTKQWCTALLAAAVLVVAGGSLQRASAQKPGERRQPAPRATPSPPFPLFVDTILNQRLSFIRHLAQLTFDSSDTARDQRYLMLKDSATRSYVVGPFAIVEPEIGASEIAGGWYVLGRVLARLTLSGPYPPLHLRAGVTYVGVRNVRCDSALGILIGVTNGLITSVDSIPVRVYNVALPGVARFTFTPSDDGVCFPCNHTTCCPTQ